MRRKKNRGTRFANCADLAVKEPFFQKGHWKDVFLNDHPIHLEIGCGKGGFVAGMAKKYPGINFVAVEKCLDVLILAMEKVRAMELTNVRFIDGDASDLCNIFEKGEICRIYLNFSDPWPKAAHAKRRLTYRTFLHIYQAILPQGGELHLKTDNRPLFDFSLSEFSKYGLSVQDVTYDLHHSGFTDNIMTEYETTFSEMGVPINRCVCKFEKELSKMTIKVGILGYGNLGRGVECAIRQNPDMELAAVFTRRDPKTVSILTEGVPVYHVDEAVAKKDMIDVLILCGGSATDLPEQTPKFAKFFNVIDSFDTHANIPAHFASVDKAAKESGHIGIISVGWDPGMFSLNRMYASAILTDGADYTFWGRGVSQGHSDAIRRVEGVKDARQYTVPVQAALDAVRNGENPTLTTRQKHTRECYVVAEEGADLAKIENEIKTMPNYFADYDTTVHFISEEELKRDHSGIPHGGFVIRTGKTGWEGEHRHIIEYSLKLDSNPEFTSCVLVAYARAAYRMAKEGAVPGCKTVLDVPPAYLSAESGEFLRKNLL